MSQHLYVTDPRAATTTALETGETIVRCERVHVGGREIDFPAFVPGAPEYAGVVAAEARAEAIRPKLFEGLDEGDPVPWQPNAPLVFDFRGAVASAVTGAITGMEAFANWHISRVAAPSSTVTVATVERELGYVYNMALTDRYADVLPELLGKPRPTREQWWSTFRAIQGLAVLHRHALYDPQTRQGLSGERSLAERVYSGAYQGAGQMMLSAFEHFSPGWFPENRVDGLAQLSRPPTATASA